MPEYLIAHTAKNGTNAAQKQLKAKNRTEARERFGELYPNRVIQTIGQKGKEG